MSLDKPLRSGLYGGQIRANSLGTPDIVTQETDPHQALNVGATLALAKEKNVFRMKAFQEPISK